MVLIFLSNNIVTSIGHWMHTSYIFDVSLQTLNNAMFAGSSTGQTDMIIGSCSIGFRTPISCNNHPIFFGILNAFSSWSVRCTSSCLAVNCLPWNKKYIDVTYTILNNTCFLICCSPVYLLSKMVSAVKK